MAGSLRPADTQKRFLTCEKKFRFLPLKNQRLYEVDLPEYIRTIEPLQELHTRYPHGTKGGSPLEAHPVPVTLGEGVPSLACHPQAVQLHLRCSGADTHYGSHDDGLHVI